MKTIREILSAAALQLKAVNLDRAQLEARLLLAHVLRCEQEALIAEDHQKLGEKQTSEFEKLLKRRLRFEPIAYLRGEKEFFGLNFKVGADVLIPRPETEGLVQGVLDWIRNQKIESGLIVDLGTGSGCIALSLAKNLSEDFEFLAVDISARALELAKENAKNLGLKNIDFLEWDFRNSLVEVFRKFTVIVSNPPYIPSAEMPELQKDIRDFEPAAALDGGIEGLDFHHAILSKWIQDLRSPGLMALETHGSEQVDVLKKMIQLKSWSDGPHFFMEQ